MSFLKKVLGTVGIGAAKVDTILDCSEVSPGEEVSGVIKIVGGKVAQNINKVDLNVLCNYTVEEEDDDGETETVIKKHKLNRFQVKEVFTISPSEEKEIPFSFILADEAPITVGQSKTWLSTNLDIDMALDKSDKDYIYVTPNKLQQSVINTLEELGFKLYESDCEGTDFASFSQLPFVQELEFETISGDFHGKFDEVEVVFFNRGEQLEVIFEIDRKSRGLKGFFKESLDLDESNVRLLVTENNVDELTDEIYGILDNNS